MDYKADLGVFGGSGFYSFLKDVEEITVETPYGPPSDKIALAKIKDKTVAFLPRHGRNHSLPPHMINYRANLYAMKMLGVKRILGPCASGSLQPHVKPGDFAEVAATKDGKTIRFKAKVRFDSIVDVEYYRHGGILQMVLRQKMQQADNLK